MHLHRIFAALGVPALLVTAASGQAAQPEGAFQVRYASGVTDSITNDTVLNFTNTGASWGATVSTAPAITNSSGYICLNIYVFTPDQRMQACCSATMSPNSLYSASVFSDLISNPLSPGNMRDTVIKLVATSTNLGAGCDPTTSGAASMAPLLPAFQQPAVIPPSYLVAGLAAWARGHQTETHFTNSQLSAQEWLHNTSTCGFILGNGSGAGTCTIHRGGK
jgi:hypothetical protein